MRVNPDETAPTEKGAKFLKKAEREACWGARDAFWDCYKASGEEASKS